MSSSKDKGTDPIVLRKRAETYLASAGFQRQDFSNLDLDELLHELHIHQAELEVQNEELKNSRDQLESERDRYYDLFESAPVGYIVLDETGVIRDANSAAVDMLGLDRRLVIGRQFSRFVGADFRSRFYTHLQSVKDSLSHQVCEAEMVRGDGGMLSVRLASTPVLKSGGKEIESVRTAVSDLTAQITAEAESAEARKEITRRKTETLRLMERFRLVAENTSSAIFICDDERFRFVNSACERLTGHDRAALLRMKPWRTIKPLLRAETEKRLRAAMEEEKGGQTCTLTLLTAQGEERQVEITIDRAIDGGKPALLGTAVDVTAHKRLETELKERLDQRTLELTEVLRKLEADAADQIAAGGADDRREETAAVLERQIENLNTAMEVLLQKRQADRQRMEENITASIRQVILPEMQTLRGHSKDPEVRRCLDLLERELDQMTSSFACTLTGRYNLSSTEIRVAQLIKEGLTTDEISDHLNLAPKTIGYHRNNIRKKLGIQNKKVNLQTHLLSLS